MNTMIKKLFFSFILAFPLAASCQNVKEKTWMENADKYMYSDPDAAIGYCTQALKIDPANPTAYCIRGICRNNKRQYDQAIEDFMKAIRLLPNYSNAYCNMANAYFGKEDYAKALSSFNKGVETDPRNKYAFKMRADFYILQKYFEKAIMDYTAALKLDAGMAEAYGNRGAAYIQVGNFRAGIQDFEKAIIHNPADGTPYVNLVTTCMRMDDREKAAYWANKYKSKKLTDQHDDESWKFYDHYMIALFDVALNHAYEDALAELKLAEAMVAANGANANKKNGVDNGLSDVFFLKGYIFEQQGKFELAKNAYDQCYILNKKQKDITEDFKRLEGKYLLATKKDRTAPEIQIFYPAADTRSIDVEADSTAPIRIKGLVKDESGVESVTVNGAKAMTLENNGEFTHLLDFNPGANTITIAAVDKNGNKAVRTFTYMANRKENAPAARPVNNATPELSPALYSYHAILIGEANYEDINIPKLSKPVQDAREMKALLEKEFTFNPENVLLLENKRKNDILAAIFPTCNSLKENDNLLIFYAGHGTASGENERQGYWIPVDAHKGNTWEYISFDDIKAALKNCHAKHILIIADACFAGNLTRGLGEDAPLDITKQYESQSRRAMTSGNDEPVDDNSFFLFHLKQELKETHKKYISASELFNAIQPFVIRDSNKLPVYSSIPGVGDRNGSFIFVKRNAF